MVINYMLNGKTTTISLTLGLIKKISLYKISLIKNHITVVKRN